jgi:hypothetical protein
MDDASVFMSYARPDQNRVTPFFDYLQSRGFNVWLDCKSLMPGQNWDFEIKRALDKATFVVVFLSTNSFDRRGYLQRELRLALDKANEKLVDDIYLIPVSGAAHPNHHFETYNFLLDPLVLIRELSDMFKDMDGAFKLIQEHARSQLYEVRVGDDPDDQENKLPRHWIDEGTSKWEHFQAFKFSKDSLDTLRALPGGGLCLRTASR